MSSKGWIGVDLDGTLARYDGWVSELHIGDPIPEMVERVKTWLAEGRDVRIFTARVTEGLVNNDGTAHSVTGVRLAITEWCQKHIGVPLPITNVKDYQMIELWDDRAVQVIPNTGRRADEALESNTAEAVKALDELAGYASYSEIVGGVSVNRSQIREWCDKAFAILKKIRG